MWCTTVVFSMFVCRMARMWSGSMGGSPSSNCLLRCFLQFILRLKRATVSYQKLQLSCSCLWFHNSRGFLQDPHLNRFFQQCQKREADLSQPPTSNFLNCLKVSVFSEVWTISAPINSTHFIHIHKYII